MPLPLTRLVESPKMVAIILGHLGASEATLERYAKYYTDRGCSVVATASPPGDFMRNKSLRPATEVAMMETAKILQDTPGTAPLVVHSFSNGGAFLLENMYVMLKEDDDEQKQQSLFVDGSSLQLVKSRLANGYIFYDSCPCYIRMLWDTKNMTKSFPVQGWSSVGRTAYTMGAMCGLTLWETCTLSWHRPRLFWNRMLDMHTLVKKEIFMYTSADTASDAYPVDELIQQRRQEGANVKAYRYEDSDHCRLDKDHAEEYGVAIDEAMDEILESVCQQ